VWLAELMTMGKINFITSIIYSYTPCNCYIPIFTECSIHYIRVSLKIHIREAFLPTVTWTEFIYLHVMYKYYSKLYTTKPLLAYILIYIVTSDFIISSQNVINSIFINSWICTTQVPELETAKQPSSWLFSKIFYWLVCEILTNEIYNQYIIFTMSLKCCSYLNILPLSYNPLTVKIIKFGFNELLNMFTVFKVLARKLEVKWGTIF
jgi:hypothetical protein